ncbi:hypothetical protein [Planococcus beigongshangi]|uniref:hypothetical protein n=1 Tax=Planococcus beigongshangi TaxID=2782536 RepID=UPI00193B2FF4|nr:hypothetical protein [Planococcus beigongshangi]
MKRLVASRKLKRKCVYCQCNFKKGNVYYKRRFVFSSFSSIEAFEHLVCPKCKYQSERHMHRFSEFLGKCHHPIEEEVYSLIPGEYYAMQPDRTECKICGQPL